MEQSKVHKACRDQSVPLAIVEKHSRQRHVVLKSTDSRDLAPNKQPEIDRDDGIAHNKRVVVWLVAIALYWLARDCCCWWWRRRWRWRRALRRELWWGKIHGISAGPFRHLCGLLGTTRLFGVSHLQSRCCCASQVRVRHDLHQLGDEVDRRGVLGPTPKIL